MWVLARIRPVKVCSVCGSCVFSVLSLRQMMAILLLFHNLYKIL